MAFARSLNSLSARAASAIRSLDGAARLSDEMLQRSARAGFGWRYGTGRASGGGSHTDSAPKAPLDCMPTRPHLLRASDPSPLRVAARRLTCGTHRRPARTYAATKPKASSRLPSFIPHPPPPRNTIRPAQGFAWAFSRTSTSPWTHPSPPRRRPHPRHPRPSPPRPRIPAPTLRGKIHTFGSAQCLFSIAELSSGDYHRVFQTLR